jgi:hypothetical protein
MSPVNYVIRKAKSLTRCAKPKRITPSNRATISGIKKSNLAKIGFATRRDKVKKGRRGKVRIVKGKGKLVITPQGEARARNLKEVRAIEQAIREQNQRRSKKPQNI